tara:strand:+ start:4684 stop:6222 length:1539 start_codon:yes stop_codon:yes gene_type:complete
MARWTGITLRPLNDSYRQKMELRPHQIKAIEMLRASLASGKRRPILAAPCSFGKTITAAAILKSAAEKGKRAIFICDRIKLIQQSLEEFTGHNLDFGIIQGDHEMTDISKPIQIASIQTIARRKHYPIFDIAIVDECHTHYETLTKMMKAYSAVPFIGLSATPFSKGLGAHYDDIVVPITPEELLEQGFLAPVEYYGGRQVNIEGVKRRQLSTGGSDFDPQALAERIDKDKDLAGDIVKNWVKHAEGRQTIAFSPSIKHSKYLVEIFKGAGISAEHIDGYMAEDMRQELYEAHDAGEFMILSCSRLLNVGYDAPQVSCLIDAFPTASLISFVQRAGRIMRTSEGKSNAIYLDHAGNVRRFGFAERIVPSELDDGKHRFSERKQTKEKKEPKVQQCPDCYSEMVGIRCKCGYELPLHEQIKTDDQILERLSAAKKANLTYSKERKSEWLGELNLYAKERGKAEAWVMQRYYSKFGVWPNRMIPAKSTDVSDEVKNWIKRENIRHAHIRMKNAS